jgi:general secretion pathway protein G
MLRSKLMLRSKPILRSKQRRGRRTIHTAFTLIEVLLVLIILVILGSLAVNLVLPAKDQASIDAAKSQAGFVKSSIDMYQLRMNRLPSKLEDLWKEPSDKALSKKWTGGFIDKIGDDPWGNPYKYLSEGKKNPKGYDFWSMGPDGKDGTDDDIGNWEDESE